MNSRPDPHANIPAVRREHVRETLALQALICKRLTGCGPSEAQIIAEHGYSDVNAFWNVWTSETMEVVRFIHILSILLSDPSPNSLELAKTGLCEALDEAVTTNQPWLIRDRTWDDFEKRKLHPRDAARWLLTLGKRANLVPESLRACIEPSEASTTLFESVERGQPPTYECVRERIFDILSERPVQKEAVRAEVKARGRYSKKFFEDAWRSVPENLKLPRGKTPTTLPAKPSKPSG